VNAAMDIQEDIVKLTLTIAKLINAKMVALALMKLPIIHANVAKGL
jgi:hypothetical protein